VKHGIISIEDPRFIAEVKLHRMVLIVEPATEDIEATVLWPGRGIGEPTSQLLDKKSVRKVRPVRPLRAPYPIPEGRRRFQCKHAAANKPTDVLAFLNCRLRDAGHRHWLLCLDAQQIARPGDNVGCIADRKNIRMTTAGSWRMSSDVEPPDRSNPVNQRQARCMRSSSTTIITVCRSK
jgi:hypothetical protein